MKNHPERTNRRHRPKAALCLLAAATLSLLPCQARGEGPQEESHAEVRRQLLLQFHFSPPDTGPAESSPVLAAGVAAPPPVEPADPSLVRMEAYTVRDSVKMSALREQFTQQKKAALTAYEMRQLGVGLHTEPLVGPLHLYAATLFYIPFAAGVSLSW